jgi:hypothetical protein
MTAAALGAGEKGAIQVDSPPYFLARPVGGKPNLTALMYLVELRIRKKVAGTEKNIGDM